FSLQGRGAIPVLFLSPKTRAKPVSKVAENRLPEIWLHVCIDFLNPDRTSNCELPEYDDRFPSALLNRVLTRARSIVDEKMKCMKNNSLLGSFCNKCSQRESKAPTWKEKAANVIGRPK